MGEIPTVRKPLTMATRTTDRGYHGTQGQLCIAQPRRKHRIRGGGANSNQIWDAGMARAGRERDRFREYAGGGRDAVDRTMRRRPAKRETRWWRSREWMRRAGVYAGGALLVLVLMHTIFGPYGFLSMRRSQHEIEKLRQEIDQLDKENEQLTGEIRALQSDPAAIEKVAREDMGLARPGEMIFRLPDDPPGKKQAAARNPQR